MRRSDNGSEGVCALPCATWRAAQVEIWVDAVSPRNLRKCVRIVARAAKGYVRRDIDIVRGYDSTALGAGGCNHARPGCSIGGPRLLLTPEVRRKRYAIGSFAGYNMP